MEQEEANTFLFINIVDNKLKIILNIYTILIIIVVIIIVVVAVIIIGEQIYRGVACFVLLCITYL